MSTNAIPYAEKSVLALAEDCADGCASHEVEVALKQTLEVDLRALILALKGDIAATPPTAGLINSGRWSERRRRVRAVPRMRRCGPSSRMPVKT